MPTRSPIAPLNFVFWGALGFVVMVFTMGVGVRAQQTEGLAERFRRIDQDGDGRVTPAELPQRLIFRRLDLNRDGAITLPEAQEAWDSLAPNSNDSPAGASDSPNADGTPSDSSGSAETQSPGGAQESAPEVDPAIRRAPLSVSPGSRGIGLYLRDAEFQDVRGTAHRLSQFNDRSAIVVAMTSTSCPLSRKYLPTLTELAQQASAQNVAFIIVDPVATDDLDELKQLQQELGSAAIVVFDPDEELAHAVQATTTTDVVVTDSRSTVTYRGAVDDQFGLGYATDQPREQYLKKAIEATIQGEPVGVAATLAPGCALSTNDESLEPSLLTYHGEISRLIERHCVECHRDGGVAPFSLATYADVVAHGPMIEEVVKRGIMPPWFAAKTPEQQRATEAGKEVSSPWLNDRSLPQADQDALIGWLNSDQEEGDPATAPLPRSFPEGWLIGQPDAVYQFDQPVAIKATGIMPYQYVVVDTNLPEDRWVSAIEVRPGDPSVVHHVIVTILDGVSESEEDSADQERQGFWGIYVPGNSTLIYPEGFAKRLPKNARLRFQMHYTPNGRATEDRTSIGVVFADQPPKHEVKVAGLVNPRIAIPAGAANHREEASLRIPADVAVLGFLPHMHLRGKAARYEVTSQGETRMLLDVPRYDFNWQLLYRFAEPVQLQRGEVLSFTAWYDNSEGNPANPDPTQVVRWGQQTEDEMHLGYVEYYVLNAVPGEDGPRMRPGALGGRIGQALDEANPLFDRLDADRDGFVTWDEVEARLPEQRDTLEPVFRRLDQDGNQRLDPMEFRRLNRD